MSEAELHVIKARLRGGLLNRARRGEFRCPLPTGMVYDHSGNVTLGPDMQASHILTFGILNICKPETVGGPAIYVDSSLPS